jgi:glucan phosphoethanolaminetransferase (alkaline phosphatase superfamily)
MNFVSSGYLVILAIAIGVSLWLRLHLVFRARPRVITRSLYLAAALVVAFATFWTTTTWAARIPGIFIAGMLLVFATWQRGLTTTSVVNGLASVRAYGNLTAIQLQAVPAGATLTAMVGSMPVVRLQFKETPEVLAEFLRQYVAPKRVIIIQ